MLREFEGLVGPEGLCLFQPRSERRERVSLRPESLRVPIWAIVDANVAHQILCEQRLGSRTRALRLLEENAVQLGHAHSMRMEPTSTAISQAVKRKKPTLRLVT